MDTLLVHVIDTTETKISNKISNKDESYRLFVKINTSKLSVYNTSSFTTAPGAEAI